MKLITKWLFAQLACWHILALLGLAVLPLLGWTVEGQAGWVTCPPRWGDLPAVSVCAKRKRVLPLCRRLCAWWWYVRRSWPQPLLRSLALSALWWLSGRRGHVLIMGWPWVLWLWQGAAAGWSALCRQRVWRGGYWLLWQGQRMLVVGYWGMTMYQARSTADRMLAANRPIPWLTLGVCCPTCERDTPWMDATRQEDGGYEATLCGHFTVRVLGDDPVRARLLMSTLRQELKRRYHWTPESFALREEWLVREVLRQVCSL